MIVIMPSKFAQKVLLRTKAEIKSILNNISSTTGPNLK